MHNSKISAIDYSMKLIGLEDKKTVYFIGIGGISMSALAKYLVVNGYMVSGSDMARSEQTDSLAFYGIKVYIGSDEDRRELLQADVVVYTDAISAENVEFKRAQTYGKVIYSRAELLALIGQNFSKVIAVAGSHGKTTCTAMCAHILKYTFARFTAHIGGMDSLLGNFYYNGNDFLITEACEYKRNLLKIRADVAVLLNIDRDHLECYNGEEELISCFYDYCAQSKTAFVCADDEKCANWEKFLKALALMLTLRQSTNRIGYFSPSKAQFSIITSSYPSKVN